MRSIVVAVLLVAAACGSGAAVPDAGLADAAPDAFLLAIDPPAPPAPPLLTPCPLGWREVAPVVDGDVATCDPWPAGGAPDCAADEASFPGAADCARVGDPCPAGEWADGLPASGVRYVRAGGAPGGDGTMAAPFGSIAEAAIGAPGGTVVALGKGTYDEVVAVPSGITLHGACVAETVIASTSPSQDLGTVEAVGDGGVVRNLRVTGGVRQGIRATSAGRSLHLDGVVVDTVFFAGMVAANGGRITGEGVVVRDTVAAPDGSFGRGLVVQDAAAIVLQRAVIERNGEVAAYVSGAGASIELTDATIRSSRGKHDGQRGNALMVQAGATATLTRVAIDDARDVALVAIQASTLTLTDVVVRDTRPRGDGTLGRGLAALSGAQVTGARLLFERNRDMGISAREAGTVITLSDVIVRDNASRALEGRFGRAVNSQDGAKVTITRAHLVRNRELGAAAADAELILEDVVIRDTEADEEDDEFGRGIAVQSLARLTVRRALIERNRDLGIGAFLYAEVTLEDVVVRDTRGRVLGNFGRGVDAEWGSRVTGTRLHLVGNRDASVVALDPDTSITLEHVLIEDTLEMDCAADTCAGTAGGIGATALFDAHLALATFAVRRSALAGVQVARGGTMDLSVGEVVGNPIGANVQTEGFDSARLADRVVYLDNGVNLDATTLPVPDPSEIGF